MSVPASVSLEAIRLELTAAAGFAAAAGLKLDTNSLSESNLVFGVVFRNSNKELFPAEFNCHDYPLYPPTIEFTDSTGTARGLKNFYPNVFHPMPCICTRYNRKAYGERGGPHGDWRLIDWHLATPGGGVLDTLGMMISDLHSKILQSSGRLS